MKQIEALRISQVLELSKEVKPILQLFSGVDQDNVSQSTLELVLSNIEKAIPVLVVLSTGVYTKEDIEAMTIVELTRLIDAIIEANGVEELLGLFSKIAGRFNKK